MSEMNANAINTTVASGVSDASEVNAAGVTEDGRKIGDTLLEVKNITLSFGGVKALTDISLDIKEGEIRAIISQRCG